MGTSTGSCESRRMVRVRFGRRRALEAAGWRTWLTRTENHRRDRSGRLVAVEARWVAELEHADGRYVSVLAGSAYDAWVDAVAAVATLDGTDSIALSHAPDASLTVLTRR